MNAGEICSRPVQTIEPDANVLDAACRMAERGVGFLVVVGPQEPVEGVLTDRDLVVRWAAEGAPAEATVASVMTRGMIAVSRTTPVERALGVMAEREIRRLVVTDEDGNLVGVLALDDVLNVVSGQTDAVGRILRGQTSSAVL